MKLLIYLLIILALCGCSEPTDLEIENTLVKYKYDFEKVVKECESNGSVLSLIPSKKGFDVSYYDGLISENKINEIQLVSFFDKTGVEKIKCLRKFKKGNGQLLGVAFIFYSSGLGVSGKFISLHNVIHDDGWVRSRIDDNVLRETNLKNWYVFRTN